MITLIVMSVQQMLIGSDQVTTGYRFRYANMLLRNYQKGMNIHHNRLKSYKELEEYVDDVIELQ